MLCSVRASKLESSTDLARFDLMFYRTEQRSCRLDSIDVRVLFKFRSLEQSCELDLIELESNSNCSNLLNSKSQFCCGVIEHDINEFKILSTNDKSLAPLIY
jgi:hypothetical protein